MPEFWLALEPSELRIDKFLVHRAQAVFEQMREAPAGLDFCASRPHVSHSQYHG